jgi:hypothetical protein
LLAVTSTLGDGQTAKLVVSWLVVAVPLVWGILETLRKAWTLFG